MSLLLTADWVLPVSRPPIARGAVLIEDSMIVEVGPADGLSGRARDATEVRDFPGGVLMPGLVNAHTHLSLSALGGLLGPSSFERWLPRLVAALKNWTPEDFAASSALGSRLCIESGVTVVGDIAYGPESIASATAAGLGGVFYWEVLGISAPALFAALEEMSFPGGESSGSRTRCGLSPHSPYTSGPSLIQAVHRTAMEMGVPFSLHVAESAAESELLLRGTGPLADTAERMAKGFEVPGVSPVCYLDRLGVLDGATAIHLCRLDTADAPRLVATARGAVSCPRSNAYLSNNIPPVGTLLRLGLPVGLGTDSAASNHDLDLLSETRALHSDDQSIGPRTLIEMATLMGAIALGLEDRFGVLEQGMQGDVAIFRLGATEHPEYEVVRRGGRDTLQALYAGGCWRVLDGRVTAAGPHPREAARSATRRAAEALAAL